MPRHHTIVELSAWSGEDREGFDVGRVNQTLFTESMSNAAYAANIYAYQRDKSTGFSRYLDVTTAIRSDTPDDVSPWGSAAEMSAGDALLIACDEPIGEIHLNITTPGVGSWTGLKVFDSTDGQTFNREIAVTDETNGLKNSGIRRILIPTLSPEPSVFSPVPEDITARRWLAVVPDGPLTTITTVPRIGKAYLKHRDAGVTYVTHGGSAVFNAALTSTDWSVLPTEVLATEGTETIFVLPFLAYRIDWAVHRRSPGGLTQAWEYLASDDTWKPLPNLVDASANWTNGPATLGDPIVHTSTSWTIPADWTSKTYSRPATGGGTVSTTGYLVRARVAAITQRVVTAPAAFRGRVRAFGSGNARGITEEAAVTYQRVQLLRAGQQNGALAAELLNMHTGKGSTLTIPAGAVAGQKFELSSPLVFAAGEQRDFRWVSGSQIHEADLYLES